uniref:Uncharacterized protein n=1 Tax=Solanum lycopersicum TaxID=4081 RepID=A0A3Q7JMJ8_SOLLC
MTSFSHIFIILHSWFFIDKMGGSLTS